MCDQPTLLMITYPVFALSTVWIAGMVSMVAMIVCFFEKASPLYNVLIYEYMMAFLAFAVMVSSVESIFRTMLNGYLSFRMKELCAHAFLRELELKRNVFMKIESQDSTGSISVEKTENAQAELTSTEPPSVISPESESGSDINTPSFVDNDAKKASCDSDTLSGANTASD